MDFVYRAGNSAQAARGNRLTNPPLRHVCLRHTLGPCCWWRCLVLCAMGPGLPVTREMPTRSCRPGWRTTEAAPQAREVSTGQADARGLRSILIVVAALGTLPRIHTRGEHPSGTFPFFTRGPDAGQHWWERARQWSNNAMARRSKGGRVFAYERGDLRSSGQSSTPKAITLSSIFAVICVYGGAGARTAAHIMRCRAKYGVLSVCQPFELHRKSANLLSFCPLSVVSTRTAQRPTTAASRQLDAAKLSRRFELHLIRGEGIFEHHLLGLAAGESTSGQRTKAIARERSAWSGFRERGAPEIWRRSFHRGTPLETFGDPEGRKTQAARGFWGTMRGVTPRRRGTTAFPSHAWPFPAVTPACPRH